MGNNKVQLHRVIKASPDKVFRAFSAPNAMAWWIPPYGFICTVQQMDFKVGGSYKMTFQNFTTGGKHSFGGEYLQIKPNEFLQYTNKFDDPNLPDEMVTTIELNAVSCGTELTATQTGIPNIIPTEMCYLGWQESLEKLIKLVEPNIPDA
jgi:uncharacterized protein YndB with AHSA1/START domain